MPPVVLTMGDGSRALLFTKDDMEFFSRPRFQVNLCRAVWEEDNTYGLLYMDHHGRIVAWDIIFVDYNSPSSSRYRSGCVDESGHCHTIASDETLEHQFEDLSGYQKQFTFHASPKAMKILRQLVVVRQLPRTFSRLLMY